MEVTGSSPIGKIELEFHVIRGIRVTRDRDGIRRESQPTGKRVVIKIQIMVTGSKGRSHQVGNDGVAIFVTRYEHLKARIAGVSGSTLQHHDLYSKIGAVH